MSGYALRANPTYICWDNFYLSVLSVFSVALFRLFNKG